MKDDLTNQLIEDQY